MSTGNSFITQRHNKADEGGSELHWGRAHIDGAPFRGTPIRVPDEVYEQRVERVTEPKMRVFDLSNPADVVDYKEILGRITSGWCQLLHRDFLKTTTVRQTEVRDANNRVIGYEKTQSNGIKVHMEWTEFYMQDNQRGFGGIV